MSGLSLIISALIVGALAGFGGGWSVQGWRQRAAELERIEREGRALVRRQDVAIEASARFQDGQAAAGTREVDVIKEVIRVVSKPVYREQCLDDDGMRILAADIQAANARRGFGPAVPAAAAAD